MIIKLFKILIRLTPRKAVSLVWNGMDKVLQKLVSYFGIVHYTTCVSSLSSIPVKARPGYSEKKSSAKFSRDT